MRRTFVALGKDLLEMRRERLMATQSIFVRRPKRAYRMLFAFIFCLAALVAGAIGALIQEPLPQEAKLGLTLKEGKRAKALKASMQIYKAYKVKNKSKVKKLTTHLSKSKRGSFKSLIVKLSRADFSKALALQPKESPSLTYVYFPLLGGNKLQFIFLKDSECKSLRVKDLVYIEAKR